MRCLAGIHGSNEDAVFYCIRFARIDFARLRKE